MIDLREKIKGYMSVYRYDHTISVAKECEQLARLFNIDEKKLVISAYLHDITKEMDIQEQVDLCKQYGFSVDQDTLNSPKTLHSFSAPFLIKRDFPEFDEEEIILPIKFHTTGRADMSLEEKLLYLADYIEPTRKFEECIKLRNQFYSSEEDLQKRLDRVILDSLKYTIDELSSKNQFVHPETLKAYDFILTNIGD
ncbi:MAG: bis(5'-nucleosyl)-tetraphosphatase (symmetrical) YqeK [Clostridia bacterium]|nr:bis(5'-nucleosyl)-tetraphosphatase (symmetrical) YqeK [Clostridia bacterium]